MMSQQQWAECIHSALNELQDRDYQERVWLRGEGPEVSSVEEAVSRLFDDYDLAGFLQQPQIQARTELVGSLRAMEEALKVVGDAPLTLTALDSPEWERMRYCAKVASAEALAWSHSTK